MTSKLWCYTARRALLLEWRRGACVEWRLLADIMADATVWSLLVVLNIPEMLSLPVHADYKSGIKHEIEDSATAGERLLL